MDRMIQKGPCKRCGEVNYSLSTSGPDYCPACACGDDIGRIRLLRTMVTELQSSLIAEKEKVKELEKKWVIK